MDDPARGLLTGNRGILHREKALGQRRWTHPHWISCALEWKGIRRAPMSPGTWTELFFLDEAVALAAGHRPCALCRREAYRRFASAWATAHGAAKAAEIDRSLHAARLAPGRRQRRHAAGAADLPDGAFILAAGAPGLVFGGMVLPFRPGGYALPRPLPAREVTVLTPAPLVAVLAAGYRPLLHPSALHG